MIGQLKSELVRGEGPSLTEGSEPEIKPGDACIAAPFTSKHSSSIYCVVVLLRQCICVLANAIQMYKYIAINSLTQAFSLACLNIEGLRYSNGQTLATGIVGFYCFYQFTKANPVKELPRQRPLLSIFRLPWMVCTVGQSLTYCYGLYRIYNLAKQYSPPAQQYVNNDEAEFVPTFMNTAIFLQNMLTQSLIFLLNNGGAPFMQGLAHSPQKLKILVVTGVLPLLLLSEYVPELTDLFSLTFEGVPAKARTDLLLSLLMIAALGYFFQRVGKWLEFGRFLDLV